MKVKVVKNQSHTLAYSLIALQEMNLAYKYPTLFWDCACLICDAGSKDEEQEVEIIDINEEEDWDEYDYEDFPDRLDGKKKVKRKNTDYAKIAQAICAIKDDGVNISLVDINNSDSTFAPDVENNRILYGLNALGGINPEIIAKIKAGRPYKGIADFMVRCPLTKVPMLNLIKAGAFDEVDYDWAIEVDPVPRKAIMMYYISQIAKLKKRITMQNFNGIIQAGLVPEEMQHYVYVFEFNKYLKTKKYKDYFVLDDCAYPFYEKFYNLDYLETIETVICIKQKTWDGIYQKEMDNVRQWLSENQDEIIGKLNIAAIKEIWDKSARGTISKWEMASVCFYYHEHELANVNLHRYGISNFKDIPSEEVETYFVRGKNKIPIYNLRRIIGTVISRNDGRSTISLLTTEGVISVKFSREQYAKYKKRISQKLPDGTKKVIEESWFGRGRMLMLTGFRRENQFIPKTYAKTIGHQVYLIDEVSGDSIVLRHERAAAEIEKEEV